MAAPFRAVVSGYALVAILAACSTSAPGLRIQTDDVPGGSLRVAQVVAIANRETIFDPQFDVVRKAINAAGVADSDLIDGSVVVARIYCCGGLSKEYSAEYMYRRQVYVPKDISVGIGDFVEIRVGRPPENGDGGRLNTVTRIVSKRGDQPATCWWDPKDDALWMRVPYCDWMPKEGWTKQGGTSPAWLKPAP
jgi:hypothetical protein